MTLSFLLTVKFFACYLLLAFLWNGYWYRGTNNNNSNNNNNNINNRNCSEKNKTDSGGSGGGFIPWPWLSDILPPSIIHHNNTIIELNDGCTYDDNIIPITFVEKNFPCHSMRNDERIVNGKTVGIGQRLYQVALFRKNNFACGGSFITRRFVLTAAHCVRGYEPEDIKIRYASRNYDSGPIMGVQSIYIHPEYDSTSIENDIALLRLTYPLPQIPLIIGTVKLNDDVKSDLEANQSVIVSGWGRTGRSLPTSKRLLMATLKIVDKQQCQEKWEQLFHINQNSMICASESDKSACNGDSGGPLTDDNDKLIGIVSVGSSTCLSSKRPNVYTNVAYFHEWIQKIINE